MNANKTKTSHQTFEYNHIFDNIIDQSHFKGIVHKTHRERETQTATIHKNIPNRIRHARLSKHDLVISMLLLNVNHWCHLTHKFCSVFVVHWMRASSRIWSWLHSMETSRLIKTCGFFIGPCVNSIIHRFECHIVSFSFPVACQCDHGVQCISHLPHDNTRYHGT